MICIDLDTTDPCFNLAAEEYLLRNREEDFLVIGVNNPSVIIGKHQVAHREADTKFVSRNFIPVIRRISGGGAVYHDRGNINFSFIIQSRSGHQVNFRKYTRPVIEFLASLGTDAVLEGRNNLRVKGLKISGNAEHVYRERVLHHGTLLFNADTEMLKRSLRKNTSSYLTRAVDSVPSRVANLGDLMGGRVNMEEFRSLLLDFFLRREENRLHRLTSGEESQIRLIADSKYRTWEWNYAYGPEYQFADEFEIGGESCSCRMTVKDGIIRECAISGNTGLERAAEGLTGCRHMPEDMMKVFRNENIRLESPDIYKFF
ncbi:MAG TPA: lipoate--protein ligase [Bacteroidales bacterium]|jgi:lipoate-protein ligase A|nr:lipoate--protein ligase [Bacteroidales bacterium]HQH24324.1 lipoate--protein ligase [Bacteroidales bacterium]HQJ81559.1 lipoate--protein ligase [Bacteroidales bacterium]